MLSVYIRNYFPVVRFPKKKDFFVRMSTIKVIWLLALLQTCVWSRAASSDCEGHADGESWERQRCELCHCEGGIVTCSMPSCTGVLCSNPTREGLCCPVCGDDAVYPHCDGHRRLETWEPKPCKTCTCYSNGYSCFGTAPPCD
ncbi:Peroxidasin [Holothuria leucospilota]|uniref:Peroxidasin n=1 Tax=Holothuria leucospilota TaxID=206669 RepID=A0A9Q1HCM2_HOLLE|nr:Peroxidasin [Holothuria leucospilota]